MEQVQKKRNWIQLLSFFVIIGLTFEVVLLTLQNRDLKNALSAMTTVGQVEPLKPGERVEAVKVQTFDGNTTELKYDDPAKKYLLFVLSTTCPHCEKTLVNWQAITETNKEGKCYIIGVSLHNLDETRDYVTAKKIGFYIVSAAADTSFNRRYKISGVPETILVKSDGSVEKVWIGELTEDQTKEIQTLMGA